MDLGSAENFDDGWDEEGGLSELLLPLDARWDDDLPSDEASVLADLLCELLRASARPLNGRELTSQAGRMLAEAECSSFTLADLGRAIVDLPHSGVQCDTLGRLYADHLSSSVDEAATHTRRAAALADRLAELASSERS